MGEINSPRIFKVNHSILAELIFCGPDFPPVRGFKAQLNITSMSYKINIKTTPRFPEPDFSCLSFLLVGL